MKKTIFIITFLMMSLNSNAIFAKSCEDKVKDSGYHGGWLSMCDEARSYNNADILAKKLQILKSYNVSPFIAYELAHSTTTVTDQKLTNILTEFKKTQDDLDALIDISWYEYINILDIPTRSKAKYHNHREALGLVFSEYIDQTPQSQFHRPCVDLIESSRYDLLGNAINKMTCRLINTEQSLSCVRTIKGSINDLNATLEHIRSCSVINTDKLLECFENKYHNSLSINAKRHIRDCSKLR